MIIFSLCRVLGSSSTPNNRFWCHRCLLKVTLYILFIHTAITKRLLYNRNRLFVVSSCHDCRLSANQIFHMKNILWSNENKFKYLTRDTQENIFFEFNFFYLFLFNFSHFSFVLLYNCCCFWWIVFIRGDEWWHKRNLYSIIFLSEKKFQSLILER